MVLRILGVAQAYQARPSELLGIDDPYTAYCLDEACAVIAQKMKNGEEPRIRTKYSSPSQFYKQFEG